MSKCTRFLVLATILALVATISGVTVATSAPPAFVTEIGKLDIPANKAIFEGDRGYVIGGGCVSEGLPPARVCSGALNVLDAGVWPVPAVLQQLTVEGETFVDITVKGDRAYVVVKGDSGYGMLPPLRLAIMDVATGTLPTEIASVDLEDAAIDFDSEVFGDYLFLSNSAGVTVYGLADPSAPVEVARIDVPADGGIDVEGTTLFVAGDDDSLYEARAGLHVFDISDPTNPVELASETSVDLHGIEVVDNRAFTVATFYCRMGGETDPSACGTHLLEFDVSDLSSLERTPYDIGGPFVVLQSLATFKAFLLVGDGSSLKAFNMHTPELQEVASFHAQEGDAFSEFMDVTVHNGRIFASTWVNNETAFRVLTLNEASSTSFLAYVSRSLSTAYAQGPIERFGIGEADYGGNINWGNQSYFTVDDVPFWRPDQGTSTRRVYTGPDVVDAYVFTHSRDTYSEGTGHFGSNFAGPVSNGATDPMSDGLNLFWVSNNHGDFAVRYSVQNAEYTDPGTGHTYNQNHHMVLGPGGHHIHDVTGEDYINCFDIAGFDINDLSTCDPINDRTGWYYRNGQWVYERDGIYVERLAEFESFVRANPGSTWAIGGENVLGGRYRLDPYMYARYLRDMSNLIRSWGGSGTQVYLKDVGNIFGPLQNCDVFCQGDLLNEPGTKTTVTDGADWWYTVAYRFSLLGGAYLDGFLTDAAISANDDRYCWDASNGDLHYGSWCSNNSGSYVLPFDNSNPGPEWYEQRARPFMIDQDDGYRGGYIWNAFIRYIDQEVKAVLFWLVNDEGGHSPIVQMFGMGHPSIDKNQEWGAGGKSEIWAADGLPEDELCPANPWYRYRRTCSDSAATTFSGG